MKLRGYLPEGAINEIQNKAYRAGQEELVYQEALKDYRDTVEDLRRQGKEEGIGVDTLVKEAE